MKSDLIKISHWEITKRCNLSCIHCISAKGNIQELNTNDALEVIEKLDKLGCKELYITGGEPLIRNDIFLLLRKAKEKEMKIGLLTNGILIDKKNILLLKSYLNEIGISIDGSCSRVNDKIRGQGTYKKILKTISLIQKYKIPLTLYVTLNNLNLLDFKRIITFTKSLNIRLIRVNEISLRGRAYKNKKILRIKKKNLRNYLLKTFHKLNSNKLKKENPIIYNKCECNSSTIFLSPNGYIYPCIEVFQTSPSYHLGNIKNIDIDILKTNLRKIVKFSNSKKNKCPYEVFNIKNFVFCLNKSKITKCVLSQRKI